MKSLGVHSLRKKAYRKTTHSKHSHPIAPNLLNRQFTFKQPNQAWVGDTTYIPTSQGWLYLTVVKDLYTRKIVGYAFPDRINTALSLQALNMAIQREKQQPCLSDRGVQYASSDYRNALAAVGILQSMSRKGNPYDNAVAENFFSCLKCELVHLHHYATRAQAQTSIFAYIETFYNSLRPHSSLAWLSPNDFFSSLHLAS